VYSADFNLPAYIQTRLFRVDSVDGSRQWSGQFVVRQVTGPTSGPPQVAVVVVTQVELGVYSVRVTVAGHSKTVYALPGYGGTNTTRCYASWPPVANGQPPDWVAGSQGPNGAPYSIGGLDLVGNIEGTGAPGNQDAGSESPTSDAPQRQEVKDKLEAVAAPVKDALEMVRTAPVSEADWLDALYYFMPPTFYDHALYTEVTHPRASMPEGADPDLYPETATREVALGNFVAEYGRSVWKGYEKVRDLWDWSGVRGFFEWVAWVLFCCWLFKRLARFAAGLGSAGAGASPSGS
jgi:hypothetical protein